MHILSESESVNHNAQTSPGYLPEDENKNINHLSILILLEVERMQWGKHRSHQLWAYDKVPKELVLILEDVRLLEHLRYKTFMAGCWCWYTAKFVWNTLKVSKRISICNFAPAWPEMAAGCWCSWFSSHHKYWDVSIITSSLFLRTSRFTFSLL